MTNKKWVFDTLVEHDKDAIGLIAYALYKYKKHTLAKTLRAEGSTEEHIQEQVRTFHDQTLQNSSLEDYREKATNYLNELFKKVEDTERDKYSREKAQLEKQFKKDILKERREFIKNVQEYERMHKPWHSVVGSFLLSGIPGIVSSFLIFCLIVGAAIFFVPEAERTSILTKLFAEYVGAEVPADSTNTKPLKE